MKSKSRGFTLIELLVVIAIIAILAAILFPVFAEAKMSAKKTQDVANQNQIGKAIIMYLADYDDNMVQVNSGGLNLPGWGFGRPDYVWPELIQPYAKNWLIFRCPVDPNANDAGLSRDPNTDKPIDKNNPNYYYAWGERASYGLNFLFLSPWVAQPVQGGRYIGSFGISMSLATQTANTLMLVNTIWDRDAAGNIKGGGNWVSVAPCIRDSSNQLLSPLDTTSNWQTYSQGWQPGTKSWLEFGGCWPFFRKRFNITYLDGHNGSRSIAALSEGCDVKPAYKGFAFDGDKYIWDLR